MNTNIANDHRPVKYVFTILLAALLIFHFTANLTWIKLNQNPADFDPIGHTLATYNTAHFFKTYFPAKFDLYRLAIISPDYPNFVYIGSSPILLIFGTGWKIVQIAATIFFLITLLFIFLYARKITDPKTAFLTAFIYSFFTSIVQYSRLQNLDIPLTGLFFAGLYVYEKFKKTGKIHYFYWYFVLLGCAQLTKWHGFIFFIVPTIFLFYNLLRKHFFSKFRNYVHLFIAALCTFALVFSWYYYNFSNFIRYGQMSMAGEADDPRNLFSLSNILYFPKLIVVFQTNWFALPLLLISLVLIFKKQIKSLYPSLAFFIFPWLFFTFAIINKNIRVIFPIMPFVALWMAKAINLLITSKRVVLKYVTNLYVFLIIFYYLFSFSVLSFGIPMYPQYKYTLKLPLVGEIEGLYYLHTYPVNLMYSGKSIDYQAIINDVLNLSDNRINTSVLVAVHQPYLSQGHLMLAVFNRFAKNLFEAYDFVDKKIKFVNIQTVYFVDQPPQQWIGQPDFILTARVNPIHPEQIYDANYQPVNDARDYLLSSASMEQYQFVASYYLPDNDEALLFQKKSRP